MCSGKTNETGGWWLVLIIWGDAYHEGYVTELVKAARAQSPSLAGVVLIADRPRPGLDPSIVQHPFPPAFQRPGFFRGGYLAKLALLTCPGVPDDAPCVYVDLDTVILGDLGRLAAQMRDGEEVLILKAGTFGFTLLTRLAWRLSGGRAFPTGNSSLLAFRAGRGRALADRFLSLHADADERGKKHMQVDDRFISWAAMPRVRAVDRRLGCMFRREFLSRLPVVAAISGRLPWVRERRKGLVAVTLNGVGYKPDVLLSLRDGDPVQDAKGRRGRWSLGEMGPVRDRITAYCARVAAAAPALDPDAASSEDA